MEYEETRLVVDAISAVLVLLHRGRNEEEEQALREAIRSRMNKAARQHAFSELVQALHACICKSQQLKVVTVKERALIQFHEARIRKLWPLWKKVFDDHVRILSWYRLSTDTFSMKY